MWEVLIAPDLSDGETGQLIKKNRLEPALGYIWCQVDESSKYITFWKIISENIS